MVFRRGETVRTTDYIGKPMKQANLQLIPLNLDRANTLVLHWHRHHKPVAQSKFCIGVMDKSSGEVCGAIIVGRPVARLLADGKSLEVSRCVTNGTPNACSMLYGAVARAAKALGYIRVWTYTRVDESGTSLRAAGWKLDDPAIRARSWNMPNRPRIDRTEIIGRQRWLWESGLVDVEMKLPALASINTGMMDMFVLSAESRANG
jgi:hypothetical protein